MVVKFGTDEGMPNFTHQLMGNVFACSKRYLELFSRVLTFNNDYSNDYI